VIGVVGAFVGGWLFRALGWHAPFARIAGTITVAFVGAVLLLALLRMVRSGSRRHAWRHMGREGLDLVVSGSPWCWQLAP